MTIMDRNQTYTVWLQDEVLRGLSWPQADHIVSKAMDYEEAVDLAAERLTCPEDCDEGCYDRDNWTIAHPDQTYPF